MLKQTFVRLRTGCKICSLQFALTTMDSPFVQRVYFLGPNASYLCNNPTLPIHERGLTFINLSETSKGGGMSENASLRIGVFYDGSYITYAQNHFYGRGLGWLQFLPLHQLIENTVRDYEPGHTSYKVVYASWHQGIFNTNQATDHNLKRDRQKHLDLLHAGIEVKNTPMSQTTGREKGTDVALTVDCLRTGMEGKIDIAAIVTGDGDFVPLVNELMKQGLRVMAVYFDYKESGHKSFINERLSKACNYTLNINGLEEEPCSQSRFKGLFRESTRPKVLASKF